MSHDNGHASPTTHWWWRYFWSTNHKTIGKQFLFTTLIMLVFAGGLAMVIRLQLAYPGIKISPQFDKQGELEFVSLRQDQYNVAVTMHGTLMIFAVVIPLIVGAFGNFLIPLHIGAHDMAFPRLNALSYWVYWPGALLLLASFFVAGGAAAGGWTSYPTLADRFGPSWDTNYWGINLWCIGLIFIGTSSVMGAINYMTTIVKLRAPGLSMWRLPLTTWAQFITAILQLMATPVLTAGLGMLLLDRTVGTNFFIPAKGGQVLLWQHVFWFYAHPAVYILILPTMGMASDMLAVGCRKPIFGYKAMVYSMLAIAGLSFVVWGHHMFMSGMNPYIGFAFMISTMFIALPSAIKTFNWLGTMWGGRIRFTVPTLFAISFVSMFVIGGLSGIFMAATPVDIQIHDTYFIVTHFHYVVFGGTLMAVFGAICFWFPKMFGRMMNPFLGRLHFWGTFVFFNLTFFPMHQIGAWGHMRRIANPLIYNFLRDAQPWNVFISWSAFALGLFQFVFLFNFVSSLFRGKVVEGDNPWQSNTLEWSIACPAPEHNYPAPPRVFRGPYEYSVPATMRLNGQDWLPQTLAPAGTEGTEGGH